jgi:alkanesulfonate monooxygenase SsuD/methylene tetrahydromethanopterin reductase-like flavin-dependent oxidoreductase (luciferase family)
MQLGVLILPEFPWVTAQAIWRRAEALGFEHAWTYDHIAWRSFRDTTWFAAIPTLTAAAMVTRRIRLGTLVASPNFRHPVPFAKELVALDDISGGRITLGLGAGSSSWDATILGQAAWPPKERAGRFAEFIELLDQALREPATSYQGQYYAADEARTYPGCVQQPRLPFAIAATGRQGMHLAASYGQIWVTNGDRTRQDVMKAKQGAQVVREQIARFDDICRQVRRDPASLRRLVLSGPRLDSGLESVEAFHDTIGRYTEAGLTDFVVHWPRPDQPYAADLATFERIFSQ